MTTAYKNKICLEIEQRVAVIDAFIAYCLNKRWKISRPYLLFLRKVVNDLRMKKASLEIRKDLLCESTGNCDSQVLNTKEALKEVGTILKDTRLIINNNIS